jgi:hypothetical protein
VEAHDLIPLLVGKDLRTIRQNSIVIKAIHDQDSFDKLFSLVFHHERTVAMRAADAVEKVTLHHPEYLQQHKTQLIALFTSADHIEVKWHVIQLMPRLVIVHSESLAISQRLKYFAENPNESKIVRVNAMQALYEFAQMNPAVEPVFNEVLLTLTHEPTPSIQARIRKLQRMISKKSRSPKKV